MAAFRACIVLGDKHPLGAPEPDLPVARQYGPPSRNPWKLVEGAASFAAEEIEARR
jgi:hypothetical protein